MAKKSHEKKKVLVRVIALVLCVLLAGVAVLSGVGAMIGYAVEIQPSTQISLTMDEDSQGAHVTQTTTYLNDTGRTQEGLLFALYANLLRRSDTAPYETDAYPAGFTPGGVEFLSVTVDGTPANWAVRGDGESLLRVDAVLAPGESAEVAFQYDVVLPEAGGLLGVGEIGWRLSFFYPMPLVYDRSLEQFAALEPTAFNDAIYFPVQSFTVRVDAPDIWLCASGGEQTVQSVQSGRAITTIRLDGARDFALTLSRRYTAYERDVSCATALTAYANTRSAALRVLDIAEYALNLFAQKLGYALPRLTIAITDGPTSAAHSGLIWLGKELCADADALERTLTYLIAKQYFGLLVQPNPSREPWLADSVSRYAMLLYFEERYGHARFLKELNLNSLDSLNQTLPGGLTVDSALAQFQSASEYQTVIWGRGAAVLHELRLLLGDAGLWSALGLYCTRYAGQCPSIEQFVDAVNQASGRELDHFIVSTLQTIDDYVAQGVQWYE